MPAYNILKPKNLLLAALPAHELSTLKPNLEPVSLCPGRVVSDANELLSHVYFVEDGMISLLAVAENRAVAGVAMVGREGVVGAAPLLLGCESTVGRHKVLASGTALFIKTRQFRKALRTSPKLQAACEAHTRALLMQVLQAVACGKSHTGEQQCARWLLMCADQAGDCTFTIAPECLAETLGVRQSALDAIASTLEQAGLIRYAAGAVTVVDRQGLQTAACECYRMRDR